MDFVWLEKIPRASARFILKSRVKEKNKFGKIYKMFEDPYGLVMACDEPFYDYGNNILYLGDGTPKEIYCPRVYKDDLLKLIERINKEMND